MTHKRNVENNGTTTPIKWKLTVIIHALIFHLIGFVLLVISIIMLATGYCFISFSHSPSIAINCYYNVSKWTMLFCIVCTQPHIWTQLMLMHRSFSLWLLWWVIVVRHSRNRPNGHTLWMNASTGMSRDIYSRPQNQTGIMSWIHFVRCWTRTAPSPTLMPRHCLTVS